MAIPESRRSRATLTLNPKKTDTVISRKVERLIQLTGKKAPEIIRAANREGLRWIQLKAKENLEQKIVSHGRPHFRSFRLEGAVVSDNFSTADGRGIKFLIDKKIRNVVPYYASLEYGDRSQIGRRIPFFFLSTGFGIRSLNRAGAHEHEFKQHQAPDIARVNDAARSNRLSDRIIGPRERQRGGPNSDGGLYAERHTALIQRPVPKYRYGRNAGDSFISQGIYETILNTKIAESGLEKEGIHFVLHGSFR